MNTSGLAERGVVELSKASAEGPELTVFLAGDVCPNRKAGRVLAEGKTSDAFGRAAPAMRDADLAVLNLEAPVTRSRRPILKTGPNLKLDASIVAPLRRAGFEAVSLANNHIRDFGPAPVEQTVRLLEEHGFRWFGAGPSPAEAMQPAVMRVRGVRIALLGFAENEFGNADETGWGAAPMRPAINCEAVQQARRRADVVLVFVHGGNEFCPFPSPRMVELYRAYVRAGASAVVGSHAHVPQGFEVHNGAPIFYGLGNLLFPWPAGAVNPYWYRGFAVRLVLTGPPRLQEGTVDYYDVSARTLDRSPAEVEVAYRVTTGTGEPVLHGKVRTDAEGRARIALPAHVASNSRLEVFRPEKAPPLPTSTTVTRLGEAERGGETLSERRNQTATATTAAGKVVGQKADFDVEGEPADKPGLPRFGGQTAGDAGGVGGGGLGGGGGGDRSGGTLMKREPAATPPAVADATADDAVADDIRVPNEPAMEPAEEAAADDGAVVEDAETLDAELAERPLPEAIAAIEADEEPRGTVRAPARPEAEALARASRPDQSLQSMVTRDSRTDHYYEDLSRPQSGAEVLAAPKQSPVDEVYWATRLQVDPTRYVTRLSTDKPLYQPGETVWYRSLTLSRYAMRPPEETTVEFELAGPGALQGGAPEENAERLRSILHGRGDQPGTDIVVLNAAAALVVAGEAPDLKLGVTRARQSIMSGQAVEKLEALQAFTNQE